MSNSNTLTNSTLFLTGGAGFVGSYILEELLPYNPKKIYIVDNFFRGSKRNIEHLLSDTRIELEVADLRTPGIIDKYMSQCDYCFHLSALRINACAANPRDGFEVMVQNTFDLVEAAVKYGIKKFIYSSSASVYGLAHTFPTPESNHPYDNQTFYGAAKTFGEGLLRSFEHSNGLKWVGLRYFNIYGPRMDTDGKYTEVMIRWLDCIRSGKPPLIYGDGSTTMDFIHVRDVAKANVAALISSVTGEVFNVATQTETSLRQLLDLLLKVNNSSLQPEYRPENTVNPVSRRLADISKARQQLGWNPSISLDKGLTELSQWYFNRIAAQ